MKIANKFPLAVALCLTLLVAAGCGGPNVQYGDPDDVEIVTSSWGSTDLQTTAEAMTQSLLDSRWIASAQASPKVRLREVRNMTDEHIDTKGMTDKIRVKLLKSGMVRFLADDANMDQVFNERDFTESVTRRGENKPMADTDYIVTGTVRSIRKVTKKQADLYYQITLELVDPQSGEIVWADEKEIRKISENPKVGW